MYLFIIHIIFSVVMYYVHEHYFITFIIKECMFVCESSSGEGPLWGGSPWCWFFSW